MCSGDYIEANNRALSLMNISIDALKGVYRELDMARILLILGEYDDAIEGHLVLDRTYSNYEDIGQ